MARLVFLANERYDAGMQNDADLLKHYSARITQLEDEIEELTVALSQAWDQLAPLLQDTPLHITDANNILLLLDSIVTATEGYAAAIYLQEENLWRSVPSHVTLPPIVKQAVAQITPQDTVLYRVSSERTNTPTPNAKWALVPLLAEQKAVGALVLGIQANSQKPDFTALDLRLLQRVSDRITGQIISTRLALSQERAAKLAYELDIASNIQRSIQPGKPPHLNTLEVVAHWQPARYVGGDAWSWLQQSGGQMCFFILDVAGKGLPAALAAVSLHAAIRIALKADMSPGEVLQMVNAEFYDAYTLTDLLATVSILRVSPDGRELEQANAGHPPTLLRRGESWLTLPASVPPVGVLPELIPDTQTLALEKDDLIFCYTDGFTEIETENGLWGESGICGAVPVGIHSAAGAVQAVTTAAERIRKGTELHDDQTLIVLRRT
ncbi:MAG: serine/threonine-protein phosphatase [Anaerolineae bacterium]|nr:serine/threonine-protein phosphatase [Anaerolineae bacterium]